MRGDGSARSPVDRVIRGDNRTDLPDSDESAIPKSNPVKIIGSPRISRCPVYPVRGCNECGVLPHGYELARGKAHVRKFIGGTGVGRSPISSICGGENE